MIGLNTINNNTVSINNKLLGEMIDKLSTVHKRIELLTIVRQTSMLTITLMDQINNQRRYGLYQLDTGTSFN